MPMNVVLLQIFIEAQVSPVIGIDRRQFLDDEPRNVRPLAFDVLAIDAVVADERIGHRHDLTLVGWIGQDFLVAGHGSVEDDFAFGGAGRAEGTAGENGAVFQGELGDFGVRDHWRGL